MSSLDGCGDTEDAGVGWSGFLDDGHCWFELALALPLPENAPISINPISPPS